MACAKVGRAAHRYTEHREMSNATVRAVRGVASQWHRAPRRWGHRLHGMCSYLAMFPPAIPHVFIHWLTQAGDVVYDPFSGRGTTVLEACLAGRVGLGSDANPLAWLLTSAKCAPPTHDEINRRLDALSSRCSPKIDSSVPDEILMLFSTRVLRQLRYLQSALRPSRRVDRYLLAVLAGTLHGNANRHGGVRGLTVPMPNTFAMSPGYVSRYIRRHGLQPPDVDVVNALRWRLASLAPPDPPFTRGRAWLQDASKRSRYPTNYSPAKLIFTSPPYLQVIKYAKFNWIRHWLIGSQPKQVDTNLFATSSLDRYLMFMESVFAELRSVLRDDGFLCLVIGDVRREDREINLAHAVAERLEGFSDLRLLGTVRDSIPVQHKVSRIWGSRRGKATRTDRILIFAGPKARRLPPLPSFRWTTA